MESRPMVRQLLIMVGMLSCAVLVYAQPPDSTGTMLTPKSLEQINAELYKQLDPNGIVYTRANALGDYQTAIVALHYLLAADPQNTYLQDSLAALYDRVGNHGACYRWCMQILNERPDADFVLQLVASIEEQQGEYLAALGHYERVLKLKGGYFWRYKVAGLQFQVGRHGECGANVESMLTDPGIDAETLYVSWDNGGGPVPLRAALLNLRGNLELALGKENLARKSFREALRYAPDFGLAKNNLAALQAKQQPPHDGGG